jgi:ADP-ribose pyrophosphatase YjhB (NUDIX family)/chloramphenicol 3-O-phosphotransferase
MPEITVSLLVLTESGALLVREPEAPVWRFPGGRFLESDDTVEEAVRREARRLLGVDVGPEPEFFETFYERDAGGTVVHNVFHAPPDLDPRPHDSLLVRWAGPDDLDEVALPEWVRDALTVAFGGAPSPLSLADLERAIDRAVERAPVVIVTGPAGAGKSTVARELCRRYPRAAHIDVDLLREFVVSGFASPVPGESDPEEAARQTDVAIRNAVALARNFGAAGIISVIDEVLQAPAEVDEYLEGLGPYTETYLITLAPDAATLAARDQGRPPEQRMGERSAELGRIFAANGETRGLRLDTSAMTVEETVDSILERIGEARVISQWEDGS